MHWRCMVVVVASAVSAGAVRVTDHTKGAHVKNRLLIALALATGTAFAVSGCADSPAVQEAPDSALVREGISERTVTLSDGRDITCLVYARYQSGGGGLSCDWP